LKPRGSEKDGEAEGGLNEVVVLDVAGVGVAKWASGPMASGERPRLEPMGTKVVGVESAVEPSGRVRVRVSPDSAMLKLVWYPAVDEVEMPYRLER
jgi:hypothetical protein